MSQERTFMADFPLMGEFPTEPITHILSESESHILIDPLTHILIDPLTHIFKWAINSLFNAIS